MSKPETPPTPPPALTTASPDLPDTPTARAIRDAGHALLAALQHYNEVLRPLGVGLTDEQRRSGVGKLYDREAPQLAKVAHFAAANPALVKGLAAKDGGTDMNTFETAVLLDHLSVHQAARDITAAFDAQSASLHELLGDLAIHRGALARPPLLAAYKLFGAIAEHDLDVRGALKSVIDFYDRGKSKK